MTTTAELILKRNHARGVTLYRDGAALCWLPADAMNAEQVACLKRHEADVLALLALLDARDAEVLSWLELPCGRLK